MIRIALKDLLGRKLRLVLTSLAIVMGVAMVSGTFVLTDTINAGFKTIFTTAFATSDAVVTGKEVFGGSQNAPVVPRVDARHASAAPPRRRRGRGRGRRPGAVRRPATGRSSRTAAHPASRSASTRTATSASTRSRSSPARWPRGPRPGRRWTSTPPSAQHFTVGDRLGVVARAGKEKHVHAVSGIARFGDVTSLGGATLAIFDLPTAQALFNKEGQLDQIYVAAKPGVSSSELVAPDRVGAAAAHAGADRRAAGEGADRRDRLAARVPAATSCSRSAAIALFVGAFVIANTLSITVAQRTREFATLRTVGATARQVPLGRDRRGPHDGPARVGGRPLRRASASRRASTALQLLFGADRLPQTGLVFATRTVIVSIVLGTVVTLLASLRPAIRATRVPPIAAVREGSVLPPSRFARFGPSSRWSSARGVARARLLRRLRHGGSTGAAPAAARGRRARGVRRRRDGRAELARPARLRARTACAAVGGVAGDLARSNSMRNPSRTASTAAALMIGLALVTIVAVLGPGAQVASSRAPSAPSSTPITRSPRRTASRRRRSTRPTRCASPASRPSSPACAPADGRAFGKTIAVTGVEPDSRRCCGSSGRRARTHRSRGWGPTARSSTKGYAKDHDLTVGSPSSSRRLAARRST